VELELLEQTQTAQVVAGRVLQVTAQTRLEIQVVLAVLVEVAEALALHQPVAEQVLSTFSTRRHYEHIYL
jgi:hypothetical protein